MPDVNELAAAQIAAIDAEIRRLKSGRSNPELVSLEMQSKLSELMAARRRREKLVLAGPRGAALVA
jgi:hypothetical protein